MKIYVHKDCGQPAVEMPDDFAPQAPSTFPLNCLHCLQDIQDQSDLMAIEQMGQ